MGCHYLPLPPCGRCLSADGAEQSERDLSWYRRNLVFKWERESGHDQFLHEEGQDRTHNKPMNLRYHLTVWWLNWCKSDFKPIAIKYGQFMKNCLSLSMSGFLTGILRNYVFKRMSAHVIVVHKCGNSNDILFSPVSLFPLHILPFFLFCWIVAVSLSYLFRSSAYDAFSE